MDKSMFEGRKLRPKDNHPHLHMNLSQLGLIMASSYEGGMHTWREQSGGHFRHIFLRTEICGKG